MRGGQVASRQLHGLKIAGSIPALATVLVLAACAQQPARPVPVVLPLPPRPVLTPVPASSVACLSDSAYTALVNRERALRTWGLELEAIIQSSNSQSQGKR